MGELVQKTQFRAEEVQKPKPTETATAQNKAQSDEISQLKADKAGLVATNQALQAQLDSLQARFDKFLSNAD